MQDKNSVAYWLQRFPAQGYSIAHYHIILDELNSDKNPRRLSDGERHAQRKAIEQLIKQEKQQ